jgi:hypothetical protein
MDTYQAAYDAVRSKISNGDIGSAVESALRDANISFYVERAFLNISEEAAMASREHSRPSAVYRPALSIDGNQWCALYGENLQDGVSGFGDSPELAMQSFDSNWYTKLVPAGVA